MAYEYMTGMGRLPHPSFFEDQARRGICVFESGIYPGHPSEITGFKKTVETAAEAEALTAKGCKLSRRRTIRVPVTTGPFAGGSMARPLPGGEFCCLPESSEQVAVAPPPVPERCPTNCWWDAQLQRCECAPYGPPAPPGVTTPGAPPAALPVETPPQPLVTNGQAQPDAARPIPWGWIAAAALGAGALVWFLKR